jgi:putative intracellular protease/amidase
MICTRILGWQTSESDERDPSRKVKVLLILDDDFGANFLISQNGLLSIKEQFENYGWDLTLAGIKDSLISCDWSRQNTDNQAVKTDLRIQDIETVREYDALVVLPGSSYKNIIGNKRALELIAKANQNNRVIAAWCRGVSVLAAAGILNEKTIIGNMDYADDYENAGARYIHFYKKGVREFDDVTPPIADGNIVTTVRSLYYRSRMCERIQQAVGKNIADKLHEKKIDLDNEPVWTCEKGYISTGVAWSDIDGDGWIDLVVSNGIDAVEQPAVVYFNKQGNVDVNPGWESEYKLPAGHLYSSDLNADTYPELLISYLGFSKKGFEPGSHVLFYNSNDGLLTDPGWLSPKANGFSCTAGDFDGDGDLDLAFGQGVNAIKEEDKKFQKTTIFFNNGGNFDSTSGWKSEKEYLINDICPIDIDMDGDLDLCISGKGFGISVFYNDNGKLETSPSWFTDSILGARQMAFGDIDGDGFQELAVAVPAPMFFSDGGKFCLFQNNKGKLDKEPFWECERYKEPSCVAWADIDADGDLDLAGGGFYGYLGIFENIDGELSDSLIWNFEGDPKKYCVQQISWGDYDHDYIVNEVKTIGTDGRRMLFYLGNKNIQSISAIVLNDKPIPLNKYCFDLTEGWISLAEAPSVNDRLSVIYSFSKDLDLAVTSLYRTDIFNNQAVNRMRMDGK